MKIDKRLIIGTFVSIVEAGATFGSPSNTVSAALFPDTETYAASWASIGDVLDALPETDTEDYSDMVPDPDGGGGYVKDTDIVVVQDRLKLSLNCMSEPLHRQMWGAAAPLEDGEAITPFASKVRFWEGWIAFTGRNMRDGSDYFVGALYVRMRLDKNPSWAKDPMKPAVVCEVRKSALNSLVPDNINA